MLHQPKSTTLDRDDGQGCYESVAVLSCNGGGLMLTQGDAIVAMSDRQVTQLQEWLRVTPPEPEPYKFSVDMFNHEVKAILDGRKVQLRLPADDYFMVVPGSKLWVREDYRLGKAPRSKHGIVWIYGEEECRRHPDSDKEKLSWAYTWSDKRAADMPEWASRLTLIASSVHLEPFKEMHFSDWRAECAPSPAEEERALASFTGKDFQLKHAAGRWNDRHGGGRAAETNPMTVVIRFTIEEKK